MQCTFDIELDKYTILQQVIFYIFEAGLTVIMFYQYGVQKRNLKPQWPKMIPSYSKIIKLTENIIDISLINY